MVHSELIRKTLNSSTTRFNLQPGSLDFLIAPLTELMNDFDTLNDEERTQAINHISEKVIDVEGEENAKYLVPIITLAVYGALDADEAHRRRFRRPHPEATPTRNSYVAGESDEIHRDGGVYSGEQVRSTYKGDWGGYYPHKIRRNYVKYLK